MSKKRGHSDASDKAGKRRGSGGSGNFSSGGSAGSAMWAAMPWKSISVEHSDLGNFEDSVFFGLEELDGNAYVYNKTNTGYSVAPAIKEATDADESEVVGNTNNNEKKSKRVSLKELRKQNKKGSSSSADELIVNDAAADEEIQHEKYDSQSWGSITLHGLLVQALQRLGFQQPTPIQSQAIPMILREKHDVVGAAETGSGKTLAFCLPVLNKILNDIQASREEFSSVQDRTRCPRALIIAPTRELALQITAVLKEVCAAMVAINAGWFPAKVNVVPVVGGMAEQKQRRLLSIRSAFVDIVVGTPGRLCELVQDDEIVVFQDMSR
jgi:ATP-dependent RNA helicase DDX24/MAK5